MTAARQTGRNDIDLIELWEVVWKRRRIVLAALGVCLALTALVSFTQTPRYEATAQILIEDQGSTRYNIQDFLNAPATGDSDFLGTYFNTQLRIIMSRRLAERVVQRMNLGARSEFQSELGVKKSLPSMIMYLVTFRWLKGDKGRVGGEPEAKPGSEIDTLYATLLLENLSVDPVPETRLVDVNYVSPYPRFAADVVNTLVEEYINYTIEMRSEATQLTSNFLTEQIARLKDDLDSMERRRQRYSEENKIVPLSDQDKPAASQYDSAAAAYSNAQVARIAAQAKYQELQRLRIDSLPQNISDSTIQTLRTNYLSAKAEYDEKIKTTYTPNHPEMIQLLTKVETLETQLKTEIQKAVDLASSEYSQALGNENRLKQMLEDKRSEVTQQNNASLYYYGLSSDIDTTRELINTLVAQQKSTQVSTMLSGLRTSNIKIVDEALVPEDPVSPNIKRNLVVAVLLGLLLGVGLAFGAHYLDNTIKNPEDLDKLTGLPSLGLIPHFSPNGSSGKGVYASPYGDSSAQGREASKIAEVELINHLFPKISIAEDYRNVRTSILFSRVDSDQKVIAFTSTQPEEGKSATISNIAISFAQMAEKVLAIDADLRKPRLHKIFQVNNTVGLSDVLTGRVDLDEAVQKTPVAHFSLLPSGPHPPNPAELLNSKKMIALLETVRKKYEIILIDLPPVLAVVDPMIVAALADMTVLILKTGKTTRKPLLRAIEELRKAKARIAGVIFNDAESKKGTFYTPYFQYEYYQDPGINEEALRKEVEKRSRSDS
ncbi:MAG: polysaccharide biosynthesis tyrosine autokinase [Candidatus Aminicenantes bacterium]|nr:polysaccharide biosynthesis tyrosine autokinase [Candidatus Aminicenantes bacterium]